MMSEKMGLVALLCEAKQVHADVLRELSQAACDRDTARLELAAVRGELAKLQAEREPRDNGDGTVTQLLPVTHPKGLDVVGVRSPLRGESFVADGGEIMTAESGFVDPDRVRLILRPAPKPPEPVTWEAPLVDGEWTADEEWFSDEQCRRWTWDSTGSIITGLSKPAVLGTYQFKGGVGTLIQEAS